MSSLGFTSKEQRNLGLLVHLMTSNPKILYAPVGTEVDKVILKVRVQRPEPLFLLSHQPCSAGTSLPRGAGPRLNGEEGSAASQCCQKQAAALALVGVAMLAGKWADASMASSCPGEQGGLCLFLPCDLPPLQANETFAFVGNVTHYAKAWLNISPEIRAYLEEGRLQRRIRWLQQVG